MATPVLAEWILSVDTDTRFFIGIEITTGAVKAGIFDHRGRMLAAGDQDFRSWQPEPDYIEQAAVEIWRSCGVAVRKALAGAGLTSARIHGIGFGAPSSLVALNANGAPVTVSPRGDDEQNTIAWNDLRAIEQAGRLNAANSDVLKYVDGRITATHQASKLLWLKENLPESWKRTAHFFDLADYLAWKASGQDRRSLSSTVCNWLYLGHEKAIITGSLGRWDDAFLEQAGLGDLRDEQYQRIGRVIRPAGEALSGGLSESGAREIGLKAGTPVGVAVNSVHAGGLGVLGAIVEGRAPTPDVLNARLAVVGGVHSHHLAVSREARSVPGMDGPFYSAMIPGLWLTEGGQLAAGELIDHVIYSHPAASQIRQQARKTGEAVYDLLNARLDDLAEQVDYPARLTRDVHILPYFNGCASPRADGALRGSMTGLSLKAGLDELAVQYLAAIQAVACHTRHVVETLNTHGYAIDSIFLCGLGVKNPLFQREHADVTGCRVVLPREPESAMLGSAILAATAAGDSKTVLGGMAAMDAHGAIVEPVGAATKAYHDAKYAVFHRMHDDFVAYRETMTA